VIAPTEHISADQRWMTSVSPSSMTMPTASSWIEHYFPNYAGAGGGGPHTPFSPPSHGNIRQIVHSRLDSIRGVI